MKGRSSLLLNLLNQDSHNKLKGRKALHLALAAASHLFHQSHHLPHLEAAKAAHLLLQNQRLSQAGEKLNLQAAAKQLFKDFLISFLEDKNSISLTAFSDCLFWLGYFVPQIPMISLIILSNLFILNNKSKKILA